MHVVYVNFSFKRSHVLSRNYTFTTKALYRYKAFITSHADEVRHFKELDLSYKVFLLKSMPYR